MPQGRAILGQLPTPPNRPRISAPTWGDRLRQIPQDVADATGRNPLVVLAQKLLGQGWDMMNDPMNAVTAPLAPLEIPASGAARVTVPWFSRLQKAVSERMGKQAHPNKVMSLAQNFASKEEIEYAKLAEWLKAQGDKPISKEAVEAYVKQNRLPEPGVVRKGQKLTRTPGEGAQSIFGRDWNDLTTEEQEHVLAAIGYYDDLANASSTPRYGPSSSYNVTLPGGEPGSYAETLLTLPEGKPLSRPADEIAQEMFGKPYDKLDLFDRNSVDDAIMEPVDRRPAFHGPHWNEPDVLVHNREDIRPMRDTTGAEKRGKFIQEIQSDWHQRGRKEGYATPEIRAKHLRDVDEAIQARLEATTRLKELEAKYGMELGEALRYHNDAPLQAPSRGILPPRPDGRPRTAVEEAFIISNDLAQAEQALRRSEERITALSQSSPDRMVPDAPWKKTWGMLGMKQAIKDAIESGMERVGWTTGRQQSKRYNHLLEDITAARATYWGDDGAKVVEVKTPQGWKGLDADQTKELRGLLATPEKRDYFDLMMSGEDVPPLDLKDDPLTIPSHGMTQFYDEQLVKDLNKYLTERGGTPVQEFTTRTALHRNPNSPYRILPDPDVSGREMLVDEMGRVHYIGTPEEVRSLLSSYASEINTEPIHGFDITPDLRDRLIREGQPLGRIDPRLLAILGASTGGAAAFSPEIYQRVNQILSNIKQGRKRDVPSPTP